MRFVLADDGGTPRSILSRVLRQAGHVVLEECTDGDEAVEACMKHLPDVVTLDISMKRMSGAIAARKIHDDGTAKHIIICSSAAQGAISRPLLDLGVAFVAKPYNNQAFLSDLNRVLGISKE